jgi:DNA anti-recombination protein RmuC
MAGDGASATLIACPSCSENIVVPQASPEPPDPRARLAPHLAQLLKHKVVQGLLSQRSDFIDAQHRAAAEVADLEARLEKVHAPLQERLRAYEQRICELEQELALTGKENRELLKARIQVVKAQLAASNGSLGAGADN